MRNGYRTCQNAHFQKLKLSLRGWLNFADTPYHWFVFQGGNNDGSDDQTSVWWFLLTPNKRDQTTSEQSSPEIPIAEAQLISQRVQGRTVVLHSNLIGPWLHRNNGSGALPGTRDRGWGGVACGSQGMKERSPGRPVTQPKRNKKKKIWKILGFCNKS